MSVETVTESHHSRAERKSKQRRMEDEMQATHHAKDGEHGEARGGALALSICSGCFLPLPHVAHGSRIGCNWLRGGARKLVRPEAGYRPNGFESEHRRCLDARKCLHGRSTECCACKSLQRLTGFKSPVPCKAARATSQTPRPTLGREMIDRLRLGSWEFCRSAGQQASPPARCGGVSRALALDSRATAVSEGSKSARASESSKSDFWLGHAIGGWLVAARMHFQDYTFARSAEICVYAVWRADRGARSHHSGQFEYRRSIVAPLRAVAE